MSISVKITCEACRAAVTILILQMRVLQLKDFNGFPRYIKENRGKSRIGIQVS